MVHLVNRFQQESFSGSVVALQCKHLADYSASRTALGMDDQFDGFSDLCFDIRECRLGVRTHHQIRKAREGSGSRISVDRGQRTVMTRVERIEQSPRLFTAHFPEDDSVRSPTESRLQKIVERDGGLEGVCLTFS